jgi:hypothetical protein
MNQKPDIYVDCEYGDLEKVIDGVSGGIGSWETSESGHRLTG